MRKIVAGLAISPGGVAGPPGLAIPPPEPADRKGVSCLTSGR